MGGDILPHAQLFVQEVGRLWRQGLIRPGEAFTIIPANEPIPQGANMSVNDRIAQMRRQQEDLERKIAAAALFPVDEPPAGYRAEVTFVKRDDDTSRLTYIIFGVDPNRVYRHEPEPLRWYFTGSLQKSSVTSNGRWVRWAGLVSAFMDMLWQYDIESWQALVTAREANKAIMENDRAHDIIRDEATVRRLSEGGKL